jgi:hypothetical protein
MNGIYKMTESSSNTSTIVSSRNGLENDIIEISSSLDIQSPTDTNIDPSLIVSKPFSHNQIISSCTDQVTSKKNSDMQNLKLY